jgi:uncharacterized membrane protein
MSDDAMITTGSPKPQKVKWKNIAYYDSFEEADTHRNSLEGLTKVRRCGPDKVKFVVKTGTPIKESKDE